MQSNMKLTKTFDCSNKLPRGNASVSFSLCYTWSWSMVTEFEDRSRGEHRRLIGSLMMAVIIAGVLGSASPVSLGSSGGPRELPHLYLFRSPLEGVYAVLGDKGTEMNVTRVCLWSRAQSRKGGRYIN